MINAATYRGRVQLLRPWAYYHLIVGRPKSDTCDDCREQYTQQATHHAPTRYLNDNISDATNIRYLACI